MNKLILFLTAFFILALVSCANKGRNDLSMQEKNQINIDVPYDMADEKDKATVSHTAATLAASFNKFREAVNQKNQLLAKQYIEFPISGSSFKSEAFPIIEEADFDESFENVFPKEFVNTISKIEPEELFNSGAFETIEIESEKGGSYKCIASIYDENILQLNICIYEPVYGNDGSLIEDGGEYNLVYQFEIKDGSIKLKSRIPAG